MAGIAETARLIAELSLKDKLSPGAASATRGLGRMEAGVGRVQSRLGTLTRNMGGRFSSALSTFGGRLRGFATAGLGFLGIGGVLALGKAFTSSIEKARAFGDASIQLQRITGLNIETTSRLVDALDFYGVTVEKVNKLAGMQIKNAGNLALTAEKAAKFQKEYGLTITDTKGRTLDFNKQLLASADFFNNKSIPAGQKAAALAKLYGRSWQDLIPVLALGRKGIEKAQQDAIHLSEEDLKAITANKEATRRWNDAIGDLQVKIGIGLLPTITELVTSLTGWVDTHGPEIQQFFKDGVQTAKSVAGGVIGIVSSIKSVWDSIDPGLRDLVLKGIVADRTIKFLFGFSVTGIVKDLASGVVSGVGKGMLNALGTAGLGKIFVQPVFVTNPNFGAGGVPGAAAKSGVGALGMLGGVALPAIVATVTAMASEEFNKHPERQRLGITGQLQATTGLDLAAFQNLVVFAEAIPKFLDEINAPPRASAAVTPQDIREQNRIMQQSGGETPAAVLAVRDKIEASRIATVSAVNTSRTAIVDKLGGTRDAIEAARIAQVSKLDSNVAATNSARDKIEATRISFVSQQQITRGAGHTDTDRIVAAIKNNAPKVTVSVSSGVGAGAVKVKTGKTVNRSGLEQPGRRDPL